MIVAFTTSGLIRKIRPEFNIVSRFVLAFLVVVPLAVASPKAKADTIFISDPSQLQPDAVINWSILGPALTFPGYSALFPEIWPNSQPTYSPFLPLAGIPGTFFVVQSVTNFPNGTSVLSDGFSRVDQDYGWGGNFRPSEPLIYNPQDTSFRIDFGDFFTGDRRTIAGFGTRYQDNAPGLRQGRVRAYNTQDELISSYDFFAPSRVIYLPEIGDGSALFVGIRSTQRDIAYLYIDDLFLAPGTNGIGAAIGEFYIQADPSPANNPVPAPPAVLLLAVGAAAGLTMRLRKRAVCR